MYEVNGIDLTTSEFEELKALVSCSTAEGQARICDKKLAIYKQLFENGLIDGTPTFGDFVFDGVTIAGRDFISDFNKQQNELKRATRSDRKFQLITIALSIVASVITALLTTYLTRLFFP